MLFRSRDGHWTYQFSVTVDDYRQGVNLIIRGQDLESSTARQLKLARLLGRADTPRFVHHPLLLKPGGEKLSKAAADTGIRELRAAGTDAATVIGMAAAQAGLIPAVRAIKASEVALLFTDLAI